MNREMSRLGKRKHRCGYGYDEWERVDMMNGDVGRAWG
jgi:hypothetical protein